jgi:hypothetical protein
MKQEAQERVKQRKLRNYYFLSHNHYPEDVKASRNCDLCQIDFEKILDSDEKPPATKRITVLEHLTSKLLRKVERIIDRLDKIDNRIDKIQKDIEKLQI